MKRAGQGVLLYVFDCTVLTSVPRAMQWICTLHMADLPWRWSYTHEARGLTEEAFNIGKVPYPNIDQKVPRTSEMKSISCRWLCEERFMDDAVKAQFCGDPRRESVQPPEQVPYRFVLCGCACWMLLFTSEREVTGEIPRAQACIAGCYVL